MGLSLKKIGQSILGLSEAPAKAVINAAKAGIGAATNNQVATQNATRALQTPINRYIPDPITVAKSLPASFGITPAIEAVRSSVAGITGNKAAEQAANDRFRQNIHQFLPVATAEGVVPFSRSVAAAVISPYTERVANRTADYTQRVLGKAYQDYPGGANYASEQADRARLGIVSEPLQKAGINYTDSVPTITRKVTGQGVQAATNIAMAGKLPGIGGALEKTIPTFAGLGVAGSLGETMQQQDPTADDYLMNASKAGIANAALPVVFHAAGAVLKGTPKAAKSVHEQNKALIGRDQNGAVGPRSAALEDQARILADSINKRRQAGATEAQLKPRIKAYNSLLDQAAKLRLKKEGGFVGDIDKADKPTVTLKEATPTKVSVRQALSDDVLQTRFNDSFMRLSKAYDQEIKVASSKPPLVRDELVQAIDAKYQELHAKLLDDFDNGIIGKQIAVKNAPASRAKVQAETSAEAPRLATLPQEKLPTELAKGPNVVQKATLTTRGELSRQGSGGVEIAKRLERMRAKSEIGQQKFLDAIPTVRKLNRAEFPQFVDALDSLSRGEQPVMSSKVRQAIDEWSRNIPAVRKLGESVGIEIGDRGQYYFPRQYTELLKTRNGFNSAINHLVQSGQAPDVPTAIQQLNFMRREFSRSYGNLEHARNTDLPGYDKSQKALTNYVKGAFERIAKAQEFGSKGEIGNQLVERIAREGFDGERATRNLKIALGEMDYNRTSQAVSGKLRQINALSRLGTAAVSNATQSLNTMTISGAWNTAKSAIKLLNPAERAQIRESGVVLDSVLKQVRDQALMTKGLTSKVAAPFFGSVEKFNRLVAGEAGKTWAQKLASKGDTRSITILREKLGVTGEIGKTLTRKQEIQATRAMVERTQFKVDPQDLPGWVDSPQGKLVAQFRTFGYKQTGFIYNEVLKEAAKGNLLPLIRFIVVGVPAGFAAGSVKSVAKGQPFQTLKGSEDEDSSLAKTITQSLQQVGAFGQAGDVKFLLDKRKSERLPQYVAGTVAGPTAGNAVETVTNIAKANTGKPQELERQALKSIPVVGPKVSNTVLPYINSNPAPLTKQDMPTATTSQIKANDKKEMAVLEKDAKPGVYTLQQLDSGKYAAQIDGEMKSFDTLPKAREAIAVDKFKKSDAKDKVIGDTYWYKDKSGEPKHEPKIIHDYNLATAKNNLEMDRAYEAKNLNKWVSLAQQQYKALEEKKALYDPVTEQDEIDKITLQQENLQQKAEKYLSGGGGKFGGGSGGSKNVSSVYKYAVSLKSGKSAPTAPAAFRARALPKVTTKKPSSSMAVSIKKSKV